MVLNTITNNMEKLIMKTSVRHNKTTIKEALVRLNSGWTHTKIARKYKVHPTTVYGWARRFSTPKTKTVITDVNATNGILTDKGSELIHTVSVSLNNDVFKALNTLALREVRTLSGQIQYLVIRELERVKRNSTNIPL